MSTINFDPLLIEAAIGRGVMNGVNAVSVELGAEIRRMLSKPGGGRVYAIRRKTKSGSRFKTQYDKRAKKIMEKAGVTRGYFTRRGFADILRVLNRDHRNKNAERVAKRLKRLKHGTIRSMGFHHASAPGEPPAVLNGHLRRSWQTGFSSAAATTTGGKTLMVVGSNIPYARRMEFGGGAIAPRPYIRPSIETVRPKATTLMVAALRRELSKLGRVQ